MTPSNSGAPGARCGIAATRSPPTALQTVVSTVEYSDSPPYLFEIYRLIMLADNMLVRRFPDTIAAPPAPPLQRHVALVFTALVAAVTTESTTIHPSSLRQFYMAS